MIPDDFREEAGMNDGEPASESEMLAQRESEEAQRREYFGGLRGDREGRSAEQLWLVSYSDFMTIMMIFFLAMYGYSHLMKKEVEARVDRFASIAADIQSKLKDDVKIVAELDKITVELGEGILFKSGKAELSPEAEYKLAALGSSIRATDGDVIVEGHTDNVPLKGGYRSNWELSAARAFSVIQALTASGVPSERLMAWGFGENRPLVENDSAENRARNRRIDVVITPSWAAQGK